MEMRTESIQVFLISKGSLSKDFYSISKCNYVRLQNVLTKIQTITFLHIIEISSLY